MASFTKLQDADVAHLCEQFALGSAQAVRAIAAGTINSNYRVDTSRGRYFLRVNEGKAEHEVQFEVAVLTHLVAAGVPTLLPLQAISGERYATFKGKYVSVFPWAEGAHSDSKSISYDECAAVGAALAHLHLAGQDMPCSPLGRYTLEAMRQEFDAFSQRPDPQLADALAALYTEFAWLDEQRETRQSQPRGLIHADLFPDNVLLEEGRVVALLDFEQACAGTYAYDLAVCLNAWCFADELVLGRLQALLGGYQHVRPLSARETQGLAVEVRAAAVRFLVTRIRDIYLPGVDGEGKDFRRFLMRLRSWQQMDPQRLADLSEATRRS